jgi:hypothetical protein
MVSHTKIGYGRRIVFKEEGGRIVVIAPYATKSKNSGLTFYTSVDLL